MSPSDPTHSADRNAQQRIHSHQQQPSSSSSSAQTGQRGRIVQPTPPAPVPEPRRRTTRSARQASRAAQHGQLANSPIVAPSGGSAASPSRHTAGTDARGVGGAERQRASALRRPATGGASPPTTVNSSAVNEPARSAGGAAESARANRAAAAPTRVSPRAVVGAAGGARGGVGTATPPPSRPRKGTPARPGGPNGPRGSAAEADETQSDSDVVRSTGSMAIATLISRITGFLRNMAIGATMGPAVASAFNVANTLPNMVTEIVLGAVLTSLVIPVLVRAEKEDEDHGAAFIRRLFTLSMTLLITVTLASVIGAPLLVSMALDRGGQVNVSQATAFGFLLLPQILFYGMFSLFMAVLNTKAIFKPGAWAPVVNNVVVLVVLALYFILPGQLDPKEPVNIANPHILLLGVGTTLGVVVQALIMVPPLRRAGVDLRPLWGIDDRLKQFGGMALAIIVYVGISQFGLIITSRVASANDASAWTIYQQAWLLLQMPYGIIGVTLLTAIMPRLSRNAAAGDDQAVVHDLTVATKLTAIALIPVVFFLTAFGPSIGIGLFAYLNFDVASAHILGLTLSFSAFTLIPYALVLLHLRVFYAREEAWTPTFIVAGITGTKVLLSMLAPLVASSPQDVVILLAAANGFGYVAGAVIGTFLLRRTLGVLNGRSVVHTALWAIGASIAGVVVAYGLDMLVMLILGGLFENFGSIGFIIRTMLAGVVFLVVTGVVLWRSKLEEVLAFGAVLRRIPGLRRFAPAAVPGGEEGDEEAISETEQLLAASDFTATQVLPPMSAGAVRGPRLVAGAPVADGRFRLLADHGGVPGARFWHAQEQATGRQVALVTVDTTTTEENAEDITAATLELAQLNHPGIAPNIEVLNFRTGCIVIADWVTGSSLDAVAKAGANPAAATLALRPLAEAAARAHDRALTLGLDHQSRIRITSTGTAILAFPAVLSTSSEDQDLNGLGSALTMLIDAPAAELPAGAQPTDAHEFADELYAYARAHAQAVAEQDTQLIVRVEDVPDPELQVGGFGGAGYSRRMTALIAFFSVGLVVTTAVITVFLMSVFNNNQDSPITHNGAGNGQSIQLPVTHAEEWEPAPVVAGTEDNPELAPLVIDNNPTTAWSTDVYLNQFGSVGTKRGVGLLLDLEQPSTVSKLQLVTDRPGSRVAIYGFNNPNPTTFDGAVPIGQAELNRGITDVEVQNSESFNKVLVWVVEMPLPEAATINSITVFGSPASG